MKIHSPRKEKGNWTGYGLKVLLWVIYHPSKKMGYYQGISYQGFLSLQNPEQEEIASKWSKNGSRWCLLFPYLLHLSRAQINLHSDTVPSSHRQAQWFLPWCTHSSLSIPLVLCFSLGISKYSIFFWLQNTKVKKQTLWNNNNTMCLALF